MTAVDLRVDASHDTVGQTIEPGETVLFATIDEVRMPDNVVAMVLPRSSSHRRGLMVHPTGLVDAGYVGKLQIPCTNHSKERITVLHGERIASLVGFLIDGAVAQMQASEHAKEGVNTRPSKEEERTLLEACQLETLKSHRVSPLPPSAPSPL